MDTTINTLNAQQAATLSASLMNKSKAALITKAALVGIDTTGMSKVQIVVAIVGKSSSIQSAPKHFDFSGLQLL